MKRRTNPKSSRFCAFCKYWYDPTNNYIAPVKFSTLWEFETNAKCMCLLKKNEKQSTVSCPSFVSKV